MNDEFKVNNFNKVMELLGDQSKKSDVNMNSQTEIL